MADEETHAIKYTAIPVRRRKSQEIVPLQLSPSSISAFHQCRQRYKFLYIDKLGDKYGKPRPYFTMANHVHATVKDFLRLQPVQLRTVANIEKLLQHNWQRYRVGFRDNKDEMRWREKAVAQLKGFIDNYDVTVHPLMMEEFMEVEITRGLRLRGRLDRVDREPDGSLHIIDYKTGNMPPEVDWTQLELHALILSKHAQQPISKVSYLYLRPSIMQSIPISVERLFRVHWELLNTAKKISREQKFRPNLGLWCGNCDFISICPGREKAESLVGAKSQLELWDDFSDDWGGNR